MNSPRRRIIVAITGASGFVYGIRLLESLRSVPDVETHLILSAGSRMTLASETSMGPDEIEAMADVVHPVRNLGASISSGSFSTEGMVVAPCSIKTLSGIANCYSDNLISRAADVVLKERRRLVLMVRETPLHAGHIRLMSDVTQAGAIIFPPVPAFYHRPTSVDEIVDQSVGRVLDLFDIDAGLFARWSGVTDAVKALHSPNSGSND